MQVLEKGKVRVTIGKKVIPTGRQVITLKAGLFKKSWTVDYATRVEWAVFLQKVAKALEK